MYVSVKNFKYLYDCDLGSLRPFTAKINGNFNCFGNKYICNTLNVYMFLKTIWFVSFQI